MTQSFSDQAVLNTLTSSAGEVSSANDTFTIVVPKGTTSVALKYGIADQFGLLYVNDKLVDDTKQQTYELTAAPLSLKVKVYAEDHKTVRDYSVVIKVKEDDVKKDDTPKNNNNNSGSSQNTATPKSSNTSKKKVSLSITGKKSVKKGKTITLTVKKKNVKGKAKWSVNKKKLAKLKKKSATKVVLKARKKGKVKVTVKVGKLKATKTITIK